MLILSRGAQGIGGAIMFATSLALLGRRFRGRTGGWRWHLGCGHGVRRARPGARRGHHHRLGWRGIFLVNLPVGVVALAVTLWQVEESRTRSPAADWPDSCRSPLGSSAWSTA